MQQAVSVGRTDMSTSSPRCLLASDMSSSKREYRIGRQRNALLEAGEDGRIGYHDQPLPFSVLSASTLTAGGSANSSSSCGGMRKVGNTLDPSDHTTFLPLESGLQT